jgi:predicted dehydrogenase
MTASVISSASSSPAHVRRGTIRLGVIGLGERAAWMVRLMCQADPAVRLEVIVDPDPATNEKRITEQAIRTAEHLARFDDVDAFLRHGPEVDALVLGTRCHLHTPMAVAVAALGLPLFLEKPVAVSWDQLDALRDAYASLSEKVVVSFPLRRTPLFDAVLEFVRDGRLGVVNQIQACNNVAYGAVYVENWYRHYELAGGLWLQKATHDFDYIHHLAHAHPLWVTAMHSQQVWRAPVRNQDAGSAIVQYHTGLHANYTQNFLTRRGAGRRGAIITGEAGTLTFDWVSEKLRYVDHASDRTDEVSFPSDAGHGGGDQKLAHNFIQLVRGREPSLTPLADGLLSAATCLAARDAAYHRRVQPIPPQAPHQRVAESDIFDTRVIEPLPDTQA